MSAEDKGKALASALADAILTAMREAILEEREVCAMIAERHAFSHSHLGLGPEQNSLAIAKEIRRDRTQ